MPEPDPHPERLPTGPLTSHIVWRHHRYLRQTLPVVQRLASRVARNFGKRQPGLHRLSHTLDELAGVLIPHITIEEQFLFPAMRAGSPDAAVIAREVELMDEDHAEVARLLDRLRDDAASYVVPDGAASPYRTLMVELAGLDDDTRCHVHLEHHVLLPRFTAPPSPPRA